MRMRAGDASSPEDNGTSDASPEVVRRASSIARQTMSPFCPGRTLADCPSDQAADWRADIRRMVQEGKSADEIQAELSQRAGDDLSGIPHRETSYALPASFALLAGGVLFFVFRRLRANSRGKAEEDKQHARKKSAEPAVDDRRLDEELAAEEEDD